MIDLVLLNSGNVSEIDVSNTYIIDKSYYENTDIISLDEVEVKGIVKRRENEDFELDYYFEGTINGNMNIPDSISLEEVSYPFSIEYSDFIPKNCIKDENLLDILAFLWENIVLEVPLQFTKVRDLSKFHGDGWKLISEDEVNNNNENPFSDLLKDFEKE